MIVVTYTTTDAAPKGTKHVGFIWTPAGDRLPVVFFGETPEQVQAAAQAHWDTALAAAKKRADVQTTRKQRKKKGDDTTTPDVADDEPFEVI